MIEFVANGTMCIGSTAAREVAAYTSMVVVWFSILEQ